MVLVRRFDVVVTNALMTALDAGWQDVADDVLQ